MGMRIDRTAHCTDTVLFVPTCCAHTKTHVLLARVRPSVSVTRPFSFCLLMHVQTICLSLSFTHTHIHIHSFTVLAQVSISMCFKSFISILCVRVYSHPHTLAHCECTSKDILARGVLNFRSCVCGCVEGGICGLALLLEGADRLQLHFPTLWTIFCFPVCRCSPSTCRGCDRALL